MDTLPHALYTVAQVRHFDEVAINTFNIPGYELMKRAGAAAFATLLQQWPSCQTITVMTGLGNNGGDGFVVAKLAIEYGLSVRLLLLGDPSKIKNDAKSALDDYLAVGGRCDLLDSRASITPATDVIVDALFGTGLEREIVGVAEAAIAMMNAHHAPVIALDIASGIHSDTGKVMGCAVAADVTVSFIGLKQGLFTADGCTYSGEIFFDHLKVPAKVYAHEILSAIRLTPEKSNHLLPPRAANSHKGSFGHVLVVGGGAGMGGAVRMAGEAALRVGAGLVSVACDASHCSSIVSARPELMCHGITSASELQPLIDKASVIVVGPGLGLNEWAQTLLDVVLHSDKPKIVDADALTLLADLNHTSNNWVLTPHPGEAAILLQQNNAQIQGDRFASAEAIRQKFGGVAVLKGAGTIIRVVNKPFYVCDGGNPGMATAGMGDVLSGVIAGFIAQGLSNEEAAQLGVSLHAQAGDIASESGQRGLLATDLFPILRTLVG
ncbi:MAG: NAD(P)H-hydrate dehydratase [Methylococcales bacterium]|nr:NAD(P)H-hydrate dehydratase [Methylococcales bacterium]MBT7443920.1 NAD(P)H-hydrate dehydratase [Methylococcales bacterium]